MDQERRFEPAHQRSVRAFLLVVLLTAAPLTAITSAAPAKRVPYYWRSPAWSPNGAVLVFAGASVAGGSRGLFRAGSTGKQLSPLTFENVPVGTNDYPYGVRWAPRGTKILWAQRFGSQQTQTAIFVGDARQRGGMRRIVRRGDEPTWGPTGRLIAYTGLIGIHLVRPDGRGDRRLTTGRFDRSPSWSPDGKYVVFTRPTKNQYSTDGLLYIIRRDGTGLRLLTSQVGAYPLWSPDGRQIAFSVLDPDGLEPSPLYVIDADGTHQRRLTTSWSAGDQQWSPDSSMLAFTRLSSSLSLPEIAVVARDGSGGEKFVRVGNSGSPVWSPGGKRIAFIGEQCRFGFGVFVVSAVGGRPRQITPCRYQGR